MLQDGLGDLGQGVARGGGIMGGSEKQSEDQRLIRVLQVLFGRDKITDREPLTSERREQLRSMVRAALKILTPREEKVLRMRFGISERSDHPLELKEVAQDFDVITREGIRQIEARALSKLRHPSQKMRV